MQKHLKFIDGTSDKFWQIETSGVQFTVTYGKNGTSGVSQTKVFDTSEECLKNAEKLLAEKVKKGYSESGEVTVPQKATFATAGSRTPSQPKSDLKEVLETYDDIIKNRRTKDLLPFLQEKSKGNKEGLKAQVKKAKRYWMTWTDLETEFVKLHQRGYGQRAGVEQQRMITLSAIALFDKSDINSWDEAFRMFDETHTDDLLAVLEWAKPNWVDTFLLEHTKKNEWFRLTYESLRTLESKNLIQYNPELFALSLANYNDWQLDQRGKLKADKYINYLVTDTITIERDIPELFNYETNLHNTTYAPTGKNNHISLWEAIFTRLLTEDKLNKSVFAENALQIQTKEWNNNLKGFFRKRFESLNLSADEMVQFQETIFSFFHAAYPPIVSYGIELCKSIHAHPNFNTASFLEWVSPVMMRSDCKAAIKNVLPILEKIGKEAPQYSNEIAALLADIFIIADMTLQEKAAKILLKLGDVNDANLTEKLMMYAPQMQGNVKSSLAAFFEGGDAFEDNLGEYEAYQYVSQKVELLTEEVILPSDWNDILFQFGKFISSVECLDGEILLNTYITQRHLFPDDYAAQLKPYFKQLESKYFESAFKNFVKAFIMEKMLNIDNVFKHKNDHYAQSKTLLLIKGITAKVEDKVQKKSILPLLSMPTHAPYWVHPKTLIERIIAHQNANEGVDMVDLCIAISRMPRENVEEAVPLLTQLDPEMQRLMLFCFGKSREMDIKDGASTLSKLILLMGGNTKKTENVALWALAARTFYPHDVFTEFEKTYLADVPFVIAPFNPKIELKEKWNEWENYQTKVKERSPSWYELDFDFPAHKNIPDYLLYSIELYHKGNSWEYGFHNAENVYYAHSLMPQNSEAIAYILAKSACNNTSSSYGSLKGFLDIINRPKFWFSDITAFVFACCFFQDKKEERFAATEALITLIENQRIDVVKLGEKLAFLIEGKYGALLRFVDCLVAIKDVSPLHNSAFLIILDSIFKTLNLDDKMPTNFKKLVENYIDILTKTQQKPSPEALLFFEKWADNASLKSLIKQIKTIG
jgi:predicted DNA-binding WGR domain protein